MLWLSESRTKELSVQMMEMHWAVINTSEELQKIDVDDLLEDTRNRSPQDSETKTIDVVVLGTSFNIKSYDDATTESTLVKVKVRNENHNQSSENIHLNPNQKAVFLLNTNNISTQEADENDLITWTDKTFRFKNKEIGLLCLE